MLVILPYLGVLLFIKWPSPKLLSAMNVNHLRFAASDRTPRLIGVIKPESHIKVERLVTVFDGAGRIGQVDVIILKFIRRPDK